MKSNVVIIKEIIEALKETDYSIENIVWIDEEYYVEFYVSPSSDFFEFEINKLPEENEYEESIVFKGSYAISKAIEEIDNFVISLREKILEHKIVTVERRKISKKRGGRI